MGESNHDPRYILAYYLDGIKEIATNMGSENCNPLAVLTFLVLILVGVILWRIRADRGMECDSLFGCRHAFHDQSPSGDLENCWKYGKSIHNQKIECFWSQMLVQWLNRWMLKVFQKLEKENLWVYWDMDDCITLLYIYMPILRMEIIQCRQEYNAYPIRSSLAPSVRPTGRQLPPRQWQGKVFSSHSSKLDSSRIGWISDRPL